MKKLLSILGSVGMIGTAGLTVVACGNNKKNLEENFKQRLDNKIKSFETQKKEIETDFEKTLWGRESCESFDIIKNSFQKVIDDAKTISADENLNEDQASKTELDLQEALNEYLAGMPQNIIAEAINNKQNDIKHLFSKDWTYSQFMNMKQEKRNDGQKRILDILHEETEKVAISKGYKEKDAKDWKAINGNNKQSWLQENLSAYIQKFVDIVYINVDENGNQQVAARIDGGRDSSETLENIFLNHVKFDYYDQLNENGQLPEDFFTTEEHSKLSLGIGFPQNTQFFPFPEGTKSFWTFSFAEDLSKEIVEEVFKQAQDSPEQEGIVFHLPKGLDRNTQFGPALKQEIKKLFYGKYFFPDNMVLQFNDYPSDKQLQDGGEWKGTQARIKWWKGDPKEFEIKVDYAIIIG